MERTRSLDAVGLFEELLYWRESRRASASAVESSAPEDAREGDGGVGTGTSTAES